MNEAAPLRVFQKSEDWCFSVRIQPGAGADRVSGVLGGALKIQISAPPLEGRANRRLVDLLARELQVPKRLLGIVSGLRSRDKTIAVREISAMELEQRLADLQSRSNRSK